ncbi:Protein of unknown function DUF2288 [Thalassoporum mexicanum PCC 7367]|uniref:DUF2288 domain-containing protein n=1 Tax=Thalassoporum mexicanum TaxID=3457544 RepID=UPI00029FD07C|nr:DUF2288 domain-containing protein [Pseudanabaena sp. PCC 7367]AFY71362.1 Protein of unknown function DUF2288 [Pseudanabaena sp. PCC 7367]
MEEKDLKTQLTEMIDVAEWEWLEPHAQKGNLFLVNANLSVLEVGLAVAEDNTEVVQRWLDDGMLQRPSQSQMDYWQSADAPKFESLIVHPFILSKEQPA